MPFQKVATIFKDIDRQATKERNSNGGVESYSFRVWVVLFTATISLLVIHYMKHRSQFDQTIRALESLFGIDGHIWSHAIRSSHFTELYGYIWWAGWHYLFFLLIPILVVKYLFKEKLSAYGWQSGELLSHKWIYISTMLFFVLFLSWFSFHNREFAHYYPFYHHAYRSWFDLITWEILYLLQFVALEFFFRGFILQGLRVPFGSMAIAVMMLPYMMLHLPKLWAEATGAIFFGIYLGVLALRSRSIWGGVAIHASVALTLDISALLQNHGLPTIWFPSFGS